jgi:hypothetical protein
MIFTRRFGLYFVLVFAAIGSGYAQSGPQGSLPDEVVYGRPYSVPAVKVHLTDSETGGPFADRPIIFKYCWGWEVVKKTAETDRIPSTLCKDIIGRSASDGTAVLPGWLFTPWRPVPPAEAEYAEPRFLYAGIVVRGERHDTYMSVFDAKVNLLDENGEVRRTVRPYVRAAKPNE